MLSYFHGFMLMIFSMFLSRLNQQNNKMERKKRKKQNKIITKNTKLYINRVHTTSVEK